MIREVISNVTEGIGKEKLIYIFKRTYSFEKFRIFLNFILTLCQIKRINIVLSDFKKIDDYLGLCHTFEHYQIPEKGNFTNQLVRVKDIFTKKSVVYIKSITSHVVMHELAHAVEKQLRVPIEDDFFQAIMSDLQSSNITNIILKNKLKGLMIDELKNYKKKDFISELFARYFEIYASSKEISNESSIPILELDKIFLKTNFWVKNNLLPALDVFCSDDIKSYSRSIPFAELKAKWIDKSKSSRSNLKWSEKNKSIFD
ncbi:hypothetical protein GUI12_00270 [Anaplasmataceae bacterium AB001_6]|nr:hypothetical protein GUI12_00270 [Anaplasmataceae bacterium AB001_6]